MSGDVQVPPSSTASPSAIISTQLPALLPSERRVAEIVLADLHLAAELTALELADRAGVAKSSVIRMSQRLGYRGYSQLRVALTREVANGQHRQTKRPQAVDTGDATPLEQMRAEIDALAASLPHILSVLDEQALATALTLLAQAGRVLVIANGLSAPLAISLSMRLSAIGRPAEFVQDAIGQQISAAQLAAEDVPFVISGSGANEHSVRASTSAVDAGAKLIVLTSFAHSPLVELAGASLVVAPADNTFRNEIEHTSRVPHTVVLEALVGLLAARLGGRSERARASVLRVLSDNLTDE